VPVEAVLLMEDALQLAVLQTRFISGFRKNLSASNRWSVEVTVCLCSLRWR